MENLKITSFYYIHGFASGKSSSTCQKISERIPGAKALAYDSSKPFMQNLKSLASQIENDREPCCIIGSSLGAFYAMSLSPFAHCCRGRILINPSLAPKNSLKKYIGKCKNFETGSDFEFTQQVCNSYPEGLDFSALAPAIPTVALLAKDDEVLDYRASESILKSHGIFVSYVSGGHRLRDYEALFAAIKQIDAGAIKTA